MSVPARPEIVSWTLLLARNRDVWITLSDRDVGKEVWESQKREKVRLS